MDFAKLTVDAVNKRASFSQINNENAFTKKINVGFGVDAAYVRPMAVTITSLAVNNPHILLNFYVFLGSIDESDLSKLKELTEKYTNIIINLYAIDQEKFNMLPTSGLFSLSIYFRIIMPIILHDLDSILYLDSDIVCLGNIDEIVNLNMENKVAAVVVDSKDVYNKQAGEMETPSGAYFNSGVMIIDIKKWNEQNILETTLNILLQPKITFDLFDQEALNITLKGNVKYLPRRWNYMHERKNKNDIPDDIVLLHCSDNPKPWRISCGGKSRVQPYYLKYEQLSPWANTPLEMPTNYRDARAYARLLLAKGDILEGISWFIKYRAMKHKAKP